VHVIPFSRLREKVPEADEGSLRRAHAVTRAFSVAPDRVRGRLSSAIGKVMPLSTNQVRIGLGKNAPGASGRALYRSLCARDAADAPSHSRNRIYLVWRGY